MKLYTEEQVKAIILKSRLTDLTTDSLMLFETPIELPSDDEIDKKSYKLFHQNDNIGKGTWIYGAIWMKEQILGQNK